MTTRMVIISDTHDGDGAHGLGASVLDLAARWKPDFICHLGDIVNPRVLKQLGEIAETFAVKGDNDPWDWLPPRRIIEVEGQSIGLIHGDRLPRRERPSILVNKALAWAGLRKRWWNGFAEDIYSAFGPYPPKHIFCGHLHHAWMQQVNDTLIVNPGAVYVRNQGIQSGVLPSIALTTIWAAGIETQIVPLQVVQPTAKAQVAASGYWWNWQGITA
jgi:predicted phosphodiesterase